MPSPLRHESPKLTSSVVTSSYDNGRKQRLAALADRVKSWEDELPSVQ